MVDNYLKIISNYRIKFISTPTFLLHQKEIKKLIRMLSNKSDYIKTRNHFLKLTSIFKESYIIELIKNNYFSFIFDKESEEIFLEILEEHEGYGGHDEK